MKPTDLNLTSTPQLSKLNRLYRLSGILKNGQIASKWIDRVECWHFYYIFKYVDDNSYFGFEFDYYDKLVKKLTHEDVMSLLKN